MLEAMKLSAFTYQFSIAVLILTALHTLVYSGMTGVLFSSAIALIAAAFIDEFEIVVGVTVLVALFYTLFLKKRFREPFTNPQKIAAQIQSMKDHAAGPRMFSSAGVKGVYDSSVEGFQDIQPDAPKEGASATSTAASAKVADQVSDEGVKVVTKNIEEKKKTDESASSSQVEKEEFESATNQLFKLGKLPSEHEEGPKLDPGQTLMKAMNSLDPNVITSMTTDTKKLLETQKSLMGMLGQMRPILADGKELLQTFSGMFGGKM